MSTSPPDPGSGITITVVSPSGGEYLSAGTLHEITWESGGDIEWVRIEYSVNNGNDWIEIAASTENDSSYTWGVPHVVSDECLVRISDTDGEVSDVSDEVFSISWITPSNGTIGTLFTMTGTGFGDEDGKVFIGEHECRVMQWSDESIYCKVFWWWYEVVPPGNYPVFVEPLEGDPVLVGYFAIMAPEITSVEPMSGSAGDLITIHGLFFGSWWGGVYLGDTECELKSWTMDRITGESSIVFVVPKSRRAPPGLYDLGVENSVGSDILEGFTVIF